MKIYKIIKKKLLNSLRSIRKSIGNIFNKFFIKKLLWDPKRLYIAGWTASGSTFIYQVANLFGIKVKKIHGSRPAESMIFTIYIYRDPRDIIISNAKRQSYKLWGENKIHSAILNELNRFLGAKYLESFYESTQEINVLPIRYEDYFLGNEDKLIRLIADKFNISLSAKKMREILHESSIEKNLQRSKNYDNFSNYDQFTQIHGNHISNMGKSGGWQKYFNREIIKEIKRTMGDDLIRLGYEEDNNW